MAVFSPDGNTLASRHEDLVEDGIITKLWDVRTGAEISYGKLPEWASLSPTDHFAQVDGKVVKLQQAGEKLNPVDFNANRLI